MGRQKMPEMEATTGASMTPMFGSEREAAESDAPVKVIQEGGPASAQPEPTPGYVPPQSVLRALADAERKLEELRALARSPMVVPVPKRYRVVGLPVGGVDFMNRNGQMARLRPGKILDERYFPIEFIQDQGFSLVEVGAGERQIGRIAGQVGRALG
jgi:hypothetical protein